MCSSHTFGNADIDLGVKLNWIDLSSTLRTVQIHVLYSPDITIMPTVLKAELRSIQLGSKDCGLFAIVYAVEIACGNDPAKFIFKQSDMRQHLHNCLTPNQCQHFQKYENYTQIQSSKISPLTTKAKNGNPHQSQSNIQLRNRHLIS